MNEERSGVRVRFRVWALGETVLVTQGRRAAISADEHHGKTVRFAPHELDDSKHPAAVTLPVAEPPTPDERRLLEKAAERGYASEPRVTGKAWREIEDAAAHFAARRCFFGGQTL